MLRQFREKLPVSLSPDELLTKAQQAARIPKQAHELLDEGKRTWDEVKKEAERLNARVEDLLEQVHGKSELRDIECGDRISEDGLEVETVRLDTDEVIERRPITDDDRQDGLFPDSESDADGSAGDPQTRDGDGDGDSAGAES